MKTYIATEQDAPAPEDLELGPTSERNINTPYFTTPHGIVKLVQMVLDVLSFTLSMISWFTVGWFNVVSISAFSFTSILLALHLFHIVDTLQPTTVIITELVYCALYAVFFLIASTIAATYAAVSGSMALATIFGFACMVLYGIDACLKYKMWKYQEVLV